MQINELTSTGNRTLGTWPPHIPWTMDITKEVSITMKQYGRFANPSGWKDIEEALNDFEQRFADTERPTDLPAYHTRDTFSSGGVTLDIISQHFGPQLLSGMEMARIIKTINNLFFGYKDKPREFVIAIQKNRVYVHELTLHWGNQRNPWPRFRLTGTRVTKPLPKVERRLH